MLSKSCEIHWRFTLQHHFQLLNLLHILLEKGILRVFVDFGLILDEFGTTCISERAQSFIIVVICRGASCDHDGLCVTSQGILQQSGEFRITIRNVVSLAVNERRNDITQRTEGKIDLGCLLHALASHSSLAGPLRSCQIHQVQFRSLVLLIPFLIMLLRVDVNRKDAVRSRRLRIHTGRSDCPALEPKLHVLFHLRDIINLQLQEILNKDSLIRTFLEIHLSLGVFAEQIVYFLIVDFDKTATDEMILGGIILGHGHDLAEGARNDTL